ncbi:DMT family transporter [Microterricola viridarii]|uniref:Threonine/homoserine efflux transporter RhtA n=1 Tax=Microterricola viridarii TaxID=412690 RepID=A0A1H1TH70_9MICO|nr:DMT family transporter [Microterricola viridarii]SDS59548.1 Threonine/homoserine efflux transporter RhtA [Microterricola viridarii]
MGYLYALLAALLFGANGSLAKVVLEAGVTPAQLTFVRVLTVTVIAGVWLLISDRSAFRIGWRQLGVLAFLGVVGVALLQWFYAVALTMLPVGLTLLLEYLAVVAVAVIARVVFKERVKARLWLAIALVLVGLTLVAQIGSGTVSVPGVLFALAAAASLTVYFLVGERQLTASSPLAVAFWAMGFATLFWLAFSGWWEMDVALLGSPVSLGGALAAIVLPVWMPLAVTAVVGSFVAFLLSFLALKHLTATAAGITSSAEVLFAFAVAWLWLGEALDLAQLIGVAIVAAGIVLAQTARAEKIVDPELAAAALLAPAPHAR